MVQEHKRQLFDITELSQRWAVSKFTIRRKMDSGELKSVNIGARRLVPLSEVQRVEQFGLGTGRKRKASPAEV